MAFDDFDFLLLYVFQWTLYSMTLFQTALQENSPVRIVPHDLAPCLNGFPSRRVCPPASFWPTLKDATRVSAQVSCSAEPCAHGLLRSTHPPSIVLPFAITGRIVL